MSVGIRTSRRLSIAVVTAAAVGGAVVLSAAPASAACSTSGSQIGIYYYGENSCASTSYLGKINADTAINDLSLYGPEWDNNISSVNESPKDSGGSWRLYLYQFPLKTGSAIGLSNASTTVSKSWNLDQLSFDNKASSLMQTRS